MEIALVAFVACCAAAIALVRPRNERGFTDRQFEEADAAAARIDAFSMPGSPMVSGSRRTP